MEKFLKSRFYQFTERPVSDSCWSLSTGPDGRIYAASCTELTGGETVTVVRYDEENDHLEYLLDADEAVGDPRDSGRATQCKVHYSFVPSARDGILYAATHLSGPPAGRKAYCPWHSWHNEKEAFRGSALIAYDTNEDRVLWTDTLIPKEGCRCLCYDDERGVLYATSYPRDHFLIYDLARRERRDIGRIGSVNSQCIFMDRRRWVYTTDDMGHLLRYDPDKEKLETLPLILAHEHYQTGWHSVLYDAVTSPDGSCIYIITWIAHPRLMRYWPEDGPCGRIEDLGPTTQDRDTSIPISMGLDHAGGLVFGTDGMLYYVASRWPEGTVEFSEDPERWPQGVIMRLNPQTLVREEAGVLERADGTARYVSRGARDRRGNLFFGHVGPAPVGLFKVDMPGAGEGVRDAHLPLRMWG